MGRWLLAFLALAPFARGASIRDVDFKNFTYPFTAGGQPSTPSRLQWMPLVSASLLSLHDGQYTFCAERHCPSLSLDRVQFVKIAGLPGASAIVTLRYETGGTAFWQYLYVVTLDSGRPKVVAWIELGLGAQMGLRHADVRRGDLVLTVDDPGKRAGLCCSTGSITYHYRWVEGAFHQTGKPVRANDRQ